MQKPNIDMGVSDLNPYKVHSRREIIALLRNIGERRQLVSMLIDGGPETVLTSILDIDDENNAIIIDSAPTPLQNQRVTESSNISFETALDRVRILFFATFIETCTHDDRPALRIPIPPTVIRLQRREFYRVTPPVADPAHCTIHIPDDRSTDTLTVKLQNVGGGGVAIVDEKKLLDNTVGRIYKNCQISLPGGTIIITTLQIRNSQDIIMTNGKMIRRIGCVFIELPKAMLAAVQRYITKLEREQNAKTTGLGS